MTFSQINLYFQKIHVHVNKNNRRLTGKSHLPSAQFSVQLNLFNRLWKKQKQPAKLPYPYHVTPFCPKLATMPGCLSCTPISDIFDAG